ncbi:DUF4276 family protein [Sorangium sp. So ce590]|uniref:DUF4276 family protein n=1 Tax=Sorangium sp. So ce590 TaxID=3133317 RepID=UPI003F6042FF
MLCIVAEGQTEETFIEELLRPLLADNGVVLLPSIQMSGNVRYERLKSLVVKRLKEQSTAFCTTFIDYYGRRNMFPDEERVGEFDPAVRKKTILESAFYADVEQEMGRRFDARRFIPYIQMYEFEGLLFSDPDGFARGLYKPELAAPFRGIRAQFPTPEDINNDKATAPSKRVLAHFPGYDKVAGGTLAALTIGLEQIRANCPLFDGWVKTLMQLGGPRA